MWRSSGGDSIHFGKVRATCTKGRHGEPTRIAAKEVHRHAAVERTSGDIGPSGEDHEVFGTFRLQQSIPTPSVRTISHTVTDSMVLHIPVRAFQQKLRENLQSHGDHLVDRVGGARVIRVSGSGALTLGVNLVNGSLVKKGPGTHSLTSDANAYQGDTTVSEGALRFAYPTLYPGATLKVAAEAWLELGFATGETVNVVKTFIVGGISKPTGRYAAEGSGVPGVLEIPEITGTGIIEVDPAWISDPFVPWATQISDPSKRGKTDDPDGDGLSNCTEFAFDGNPTSGAASGKIKCGTFMIGAENAQVITIPVRTGSGAFSVTANGLISNASDGVVYRVQGSTDLSAWTLPLTEVTGSPGVTPPSAALSSGSWEYRSFRINGPVSAHAKAFLRAGVSE